MSQICQKRNFLKNSRDARSRARGARMVHFHVFAQNNFPPALRLTKFDLEIAKAHGYLHTKIHPRVSPNN